MLTTLSRPAVGSVLTIVALFLAVGSTGCEVSINGGQPALSVEVDSDGSLDLRNAGSGMTRFQSMSSGDEHEAEGELSAFGGDTRATLTATGRNGDEDYELDLNVEVAHDVEAVELRIGGLNDMQIVHNGETASHPLRLGPGEHSIHVTGVLR